MSLAKDQVIMTGKTVGVTLENYNDKWSIKAIRTYQKNGEDVITYEWIYTEEYDKETKKRKMAEKPRPLSVYLGDREQAISVLSSLLQQLGGTFQDIPGNTPPF